MPNDKNLPTIPAPKRNSGRNGGRPLGSKTKSKLLRVEDLLSEKGINPVEEMLALIPSLEPRDQIKVWQDLLSYTQAKPRDTESQLIVQKYELLVQVLGADKLAALESGKPIETLETKMLDRLSKDAPDVYEAILLDRPLPTKDDK